MQREDFDFLGDPRADPRDTLRALAEDEMSKDSTLTKQDAVLKVLKFSAVLAEALIDPSLAKYSLSDGPEDLRSLSATEQLHRHAARIMQNLHANAGNHSYAMNLARVKFPDLAAKADEEHKAMADQAEREKQAKAEAARHRPTSRSFR